MSTRPFQELRDRMSPERRAAAEKLTQKFLEEIRLQDLRDARMLKQLGTKIAKLRKKKRLSLADFSRFIENSPETARRIERGAYKGLSLRTLVRIARVFQKQLSIRFM